MEAQTKTIYELMVEVQKELKAPKGQINAFGKYKYRSCEDIIESVKPILHQKGLYLNISDTLKQFGDRWYVNALASVVDGAGHAIFCEAYAREADKQSGMADAQITGSASSYARKYALNGLFAIDDTKDDDAINTHGNTAPPKPVTPPAPKLPVSTPVKPTAPTVDDTKRKLGALNVYKVLDSTKVLDHLSKVEKLDYKTLSDFINTEPIDKVLAVYESVKGFNK